MKRRGQPETHPVVVIGSGPAGAAAATSLLDAGVPTLLLEYGSKNTWVGVTARVRGVTVAKLRRPLSTRADFLNAGDPGLRFFEEMGPGGLSNHWACAVPRFSDDDFADASRGGPALEWPISYSDLVPWYERVEAKLNISGSVLGVPHLPAGRVSHAATLSPEWSGILSAARAVDRSVSVMPYANGAATMVSLGATAFNSFTQLLLPRIRAGELPVAYDSLAEKLEWSPADRRVVAVVSRDRRTGERRRIACRAVVVACGALRSPQLLAESRCPDFPGGLGNQHGVLGRYLHDHPIGKLEFSVERPIPIHPASYITRASLGASAPLYAAALMQWCGTPALARSALRGSFGRSSTIGFSVFGTMIPTLEDALTFEPLGSTGEIRAAIHYPPEVYETLERARADAYEILRSAGWGPQPHSWNVESPGSSVHYGGTCRMHSSEQFGVVDADCRVRGTPNVVVADSSVFTTGPEKNPVLTAMALAARAAARLASTVAGSGK